MYRKGGGEEGLQFKILGETSFNIPEDRPSPSRGQHDRAKLVGGGVNELGLKL